MSERDPKESTAPSSSEPAATSQAGDDSQGALPSHLIAAYAEATYSGPIPPPSMLRGYEEVVPGSAKSLFDIFIKQARHRMELEKKVIEADIQRANWGLLAGLVVSLAFLAASTAMVLGGFQVAGTIIGSIDLVGLVTVFVIGHRMRQTERAEKRESVVGRISKPGQKSS